MQRDCYRCGRPIEEQLAFCSICGAPQIRVSKAPEQLSEILDAPVPDPHTADAGGSPPPAAPARAAGIEWKLFLRTAAPLAALTGMLTVPLPPLGFLVLLPASLIWAISRYRQHRTTPLRGGQGARMGAFMGLLSFGFYLAFFLAAVSSNWEKYREVMGSWILERASQTPDLPSQQMLQRFATPDGLIAFTALGLATILVVFLIAGMGSGALAVSLGKARNRPPL